MLVFKRAEALPAPAALWSKTAITAASRLIARLALDLGRNGATCARRGRDGIVRGAVAVRRAFHQIARRTHVAAQELATAVTQHRHGTWLILFALLFTGLWLLAGWIGMGNGLLRGVLVGTITPLLVSALFPLKRRTR